MTGMVVATSAGEPSDGDDGCGDLGGGAGADTITSTSGGVDVIYAVRAMM